MNKEFLLKEQKRVDSRLAQGFGTGEFVSYRPWIAYYNGPGRGHKGSIPGFTTGRRHSFLSDLETDFFHIVDFNKNIVDIREQKPLIDLALATSIARKLGIRYPMDGNGHLTVMTTDFMLFEKDKYGDITVKLRDIKSTEDLEIPRTLEKLEIARVYWKTKGYDNYKIVTEDEINRDYAANAAKISFDTWQLERLWKLHRLPDEKSLLENYRKGLAGCSNVWQYSLEFDRLNGFEPGTSSWIFSHLIFYRQIEVDLNEKLDLNKAGKEVCRDLSGKHL